MPARLQRLRLAGLRWRLAAWVALVMLVCTGVAFFAVYRGTGTELKRQVDQELSGDARELSSMLTHAHARSPRALAAVAAEYVHNQPFSSGSTLLFVQVPGVGTTTNRPELFGAQTPDGNETPGEQGAEDAMSTRMLTAAPGLSTLPLPDIGKLRLLKQTVHAPGSASAVSIGVAQSLAPVHQAQEGVARAFILAGLVALAGALLASFLIGTRVSQPLRRMAAVAARVDAGDLHPRIHDVAGQSEEVTVLAEAFNHMLDRLTEAFAGQRAFVADASHELRTPLTVIRGQMEVLAAQRDPSPEEVRRVERLVQAEIARVSRLVDDLLLLAKTEQTEVLRLERVELPGFVEDLWRGMTLVADRSFQLGAVPAGTLLADPDRVVQALRNLLANAIEHTAEGSGRVCLSLQAADGRLRFIVDDDGPGIPPDQRELVFRRFHRTDAGRSRAAGGTGLGLAIVRAIADAHGGSVRAEPSPTGGARVVLELPDFTPAQPAPLTTPVQAREERLPAG